VARKSVAQLTKEVLTLSDDLKTLNAQLGSLKKGTSAWADTLLKVQKQQDAVAKSQDNLAVSVQRLNKSYPRNTKLINDATAALEKSNRVSKKSSSLINEIERQNNKIAKLEKKLQDYRTQLRLNSNKLAEDIERRRIKLIERFAIEEFKSRLKRERAIQKELQDAAKAEQKRQQKIADDQIKEAKRAAKERINEEKRVAREQKKIADQQAREAKKNNFGAAFTGSFTPQKIGSTLGTVTRFLGVGGAVFSAIEGLKQITTESIRVFIDLERQFASIAAISGASASQMQKLQNTTFEVASSTGYATSEIIELESNLIKLGVPIENVESSLKIVAIASRAMGEDLSSVGDILFKISNQFGITQSELASTASTLVKSINESALTFQEFGTAIQYVGPIANQVGLTFRETAGYMEILSNAGFKASKIGTGLRDLFIDLKVPGEELSDTMLRLSKENISLSEAVDLVGKTSAAQLFVLLRNAEAIGELSDETYNASIALKEMSNLMVQNATNMNTTQGRIDALGIAWQRYQFRIGSAITSTELFLDLLGALDRKSEATARAYNRIAELSGRNPQKVSAITSEYSTATGPYQRAQVAYSALPMSSQADLNEIYSTGRFGNSRNPTIIDKSKYPTFEKFLQGITTGGIRALEDSQILLVGINNQLLEIKNTTDSQAKVIEARNNQRSKFQDQYLKLEKQTGDVQLKNSEILLEQLSEEIKLLSKQDELLSDQLSLQPDNKSLQIQSDIVRARLTETQNFVSKVSELTSEEEKKRAKADKEEQDRLKKVKQAQEDEEKRIKRLIEERKRYYEELEQSLKIELELAKINGDANKIAETEIRLLALRTKNFKDLKSEINSSKILTEDQKFSLLGNIDLFNVNEQDVLSSIEEISSVFQELIKTKGVVQAEIIGKQLIQTLIDSLRDSLTPEQLKQVEEILNLKFFTGGKTDGKFKKGDRSELPGIGSDEFKEELKRLAQNAASALQESIATIRDTAFENLIGQLDAEKEAVQERYDFEEKALRGQLEGQLVTQEEYEKKLENIKRRRIIKENAIDKKIFEAEKKRDRQNAALTFAESIASLAISNYTKYEPFAASVLTAIGTAIASAQYGVQLSSINQRQFFPTRFAEGGIVNGPSHAEGGVPFTVQGRGGYEMEGGEFIVNKEATKRNYSLLRQINDSVKPSSYSSGRIFAAGGIVKAEELGVRQLQLLESIAMATGGTYKNTSKPVRAFVSADDLRKSDVDLRIKERNSNL
jgi:hypothetical protein